MLGASYGRHFAALLIAIIGLGQPLLAEDLVDACGAGLVSTANVGRIDDPAKSLVAVADAVRAARAKGIYLKYLGIPIRGEMAALLQWRLGVLKKYLDRSGPSWKSGLEAVADSKRLEDSRTVVERFVQELERMLAAKTVSLKELIRTGVIFSDLADQLNAIDWKRKVEIHSANSWVEDAVYGMESDPRKVYLPSHRFLNSRTINYLMAGHVAVLGEIEKPVDVHGEPYGPKRFNVHDFSHALLTGNPYLAPKLDVPESMAFFVRFEKWLEDSGYNESDKTIFQILWSYPFHEYGYEIHPKTLADFYTHRGQNGVGTVPINLDGRILERLHDPKDLGHEVNGRQLTLEELNRFESAIIRFTQSNDP